ncbi:MAG: hypothetical protein CVU91_02330 [Firmicutes bacterium HGW-Firmicutes-16]|nr:MAG: hypothetical protein CVU91_02330 [Firmicutes bacterium HGW-Firmicutes-16]
MKVIGMKKLDFQTPENQTIKGYKVFCTYSNADDKNLVGTACEDFFISENKASGWLPKVGEEIEIVYNKYGKVDHVNVVKSAA